MSIATLVLLPLPLNSQHLHFSFTVASLSKIFVRSRHDWEKKCRIGIRQQPDINPNFAAGVVDAGGKFATGVVDTGGQP